MSWINRTYLHRTGLATLAMAVSLLTTSISFGQQNILADEARDAANYLNQVRANPRGFGNLHPSFADADVEPRPALVWSDALQRAAERKAQFMAQTGQVAHVMNINGQQVGMNQWMREAGYPLADFLPNNMSNFECIYGPDPNPPINGIGRRAMNSFLSEGKDGPHVLPILGRNDFWKPCKHIGIGMATNAQGGTSVSVLVGVYDPFNPNAQPPGQSQNPNPPPMPTPMPTPLPTATNPPAPAGQAQVVVSNGSMVSVPVSYKSGGISAIAVVLPSRSVTLAVDPSSIVSYALPSNNNGQAAAVAATNKLDIPRDACTLRINNGSQEVLAVTFEVPEFKEGRFQFVAQTFNIQPGTTSLSNQPKGTRIKGEPSTGAFLRTLQKDEETITYPM